MVFKLEEPFRALLSRELKDPVFLTGEEASGGWTLLFPELAAALPSPYPIFSANEEMVVDRGYPVLVGRAIGALKTAIEHLVATEIPYRTSVANGERADKTEAFEAREALRNVLVPLFENAALSDSGRHVAEVLALTTTRLIADVVDHVPSLVARRQPEVARRHGERIRLQLAKTCADQLHRAALESGDRLRALAAEAISPAASPLIQALVADLFPLARRTVAAEPNHLVGWADVHLREDPDRFRQRWKTMEERIETLLADTPELRAALGLLVEGNTPGARPALIFEPRLWELLERMQLAARIAEEPVVKAFRRLGRSLKRSELLIALCRRILPVEQQGTRMALMGRHPTQEIAPSTRPFDFGRPGIVDSAVRRFGLTYDLVSFTAELEEIRKAGRAAEERALRFMYIFQNELRGISGRFRLTFEKFLGDGAFYSARRGLRVLIAASEIQILYERLRSQGFPFTRGIRMALNFATYHLLPMPVAPGEPPRYEFFGHGIVELARLTTGKSSREVEEIAEFLLHSGYSSDQVEGFLQPLLEGHGDSRTTRERRYAAWLDGSGDLVNNGIVFTAPFLEELDRELAGSPSHQVEFDGLQWLAWPVEPQSEESAWFGLRYLGVPHLKGLPPQELIEVTVWPSVPEKTQERLIGHGLLRELRSLALAGEETEARQPVDLPEDLVVVTYLVEDDRTWIFGSFRHGDDMLLNALEIPLTPPDLEAGEPLEMWLFRNRFDLYRLYEGLRRELSGASVPMQTLRNRDGYVGCFLAAPHRAPA